VRSVNGIIRLMGSVCIGPKVIPLSGAHCITISKIELKGAKWGKQNKNINQLINKKCLAVNKFIHPDYDDDVT
jgi:hypothetical protein